MSLLQLLRKIQDDAVASSESVSGVLRRCQVFAARVGLMELDEWIRHELNGYPIAVELPDYRVFSGIARGHFLGPFGGGLQNAVLPAGNLPEGLRDWAQKAYIRQPIVALEEVARHGDHNVTIPWPGDLIRHVQSRFYENMALGQAWLEVSRADFIAAVETVRNRVLAFALDAERHVPADSQDAGPTQMAQLSTVFQTNIYGSVQNLAQGNQSVVQHAGIPPGDLPALLHQLRELGVPEGDLEELQDALSQDDRPAEGRFGPRVAKWIGTMMTKALSGTWSVATHTASTVLPKLIERYYMPPS